MDAINRYPPRLCVKEPYKQALEKSHGEAMNSGKPQSCLMHETEAMLAIHTILKILILVIIYYD
jgi:hypothetical protein